MFGETLGQVLNFSQWVVVAVVLAMATKRLRLWLAIAIAIVVAGAMALIGPIPLELFGISIEFDGP